ncbi:MAG: protocatechuate 3,4-dioxygenase [Acidobacteria bacterium]|nr:protocatechuate 3,4-dioxygenase [Acidobacteriota bacterium]
MTHITRREFFGTVSVSLLAAPLLSCSAQKADPPAAIIDHSRERLPYTDGFGSMPCSKCIAPPTMTPRITIADEKEPGERMVISGTIFQPDGRTPADGVVLYVYHTDATGYYSKDDDPYNPRLRGWMKTGADGKYEFRSIKPAPYPHRDTPAHIHAQIYSDKIPEYAIDEYWFEGDRFINDKQKKLLLTGAGGPGNIIKLTKGPDGILHGTRDIILDKQA